MFHPEMKTWRQWVVSGNSKVPLNPRTLHHASVTDSRTWGTFKECFACALLNKLNLGFVFTKNDPFVGIDLDPPKDDIQKARHNKILKLLRTFTEISLSGNGLHLIAKGKIPYAVKRDQVEVYDQERYFIMTGNQLPGTPDDIVDHNDILNKLVTEMGGNQGARDYVDNSEPEKKTDQAVIERCGNSANGDKFKALWEGRWSPTYNSQSEADYALVNMIAFATPNDDQCRRIFRSSKLGQRDKAKREDYMNSMISNIRGEAPPPIDFSKFKPPPMVTTTPPPFKPIPADTPPVNVKFPSGLVGEMAQYILDTAIRPIPQVALAGALGLAAGICGRSYNISHTGLNLYLMLVAGTAIGKEGAAQGVSRLVKSVTPKLPAIAQFIGPTEYASGQGMIKQLSQFPCQLSVMSEFGHTLRRICSPQASGADIMWRKVLLDVFNKSGAGDMLGSMVYSDTGKNTPTVYAPALTLLTESSPASLYEGLDEKAIEIGLVPRFLLMECTNLRPPTNPHAFVPPRKYLADRLEALAHRCLSMEANSSHHDIGIAPVAQALLEEFDIEIDTRINEQSDDAIRQIWSRAHLKVLRVAAVVAVGLQPDKPVLDLESVTWAMDLIRCDVQSMLSRFNEGVGRGDPVQLSKLRQMMTRVLKSEKASSRAMKKYNVVSHQQLAQRAYALSCFRDDRRGAGEALKRALQTLQDTGEVVQLSPHDVKLHFGVNAKCYLLTEQFNLK